MVEGQGGIPNFKGGQVALLTGDLEVLKVDLSSTDIDIDVEDKAFIKRVIAMRDQLTPKITRVPPAGEETLPQVGGVLSTARRVADMLCSQGITITFSFKGKRIATIGSKAHPILLHHITKTHGIALNSVFTAIRLLV